MIRKLLLVPFLGSVCAVGLAQKNDIYPIPQQVKWGPEIIPLKKLNPIVKGADAADKDAAQLLQDYVNDHQIKSKSFTITIGEKSDRHMRRYARLAPKHAEGYYLQVTPSGAVVVGSDERGSYYGVQSLLNILRRDTVYNVTITDYPDVADRGVVEGYYGKPWSYEDRMSAFEFMGRMKMNVYLYGPKDDPYHSSPHWRKPYPKDEADHLVKLIQQAHRHKVTFVWAIHPGKDIKWNDEDRQALMDKFEKMYAMGVRAFAVFFDDIAGEGTRAEKQAELLNYIQRHFVTPKGDVAPLILCPTEYCKGFVRSPEKYLKVLGRELDPSVRVMWTGNRIIADIDRPTMEWINEQIGREAYIWWNYPVTDYVRDHLLLGPVYGNTKDVADMVSGFVSNPMEHAESSKVALFSVADYLWNMKAFDEHGSWIASLKDLLPHSYQALEVVGANNSDLGPNGHGYRREESVAFAPLAQTWVESTKEGGQLSDTTADQLKDFYTSCLQSADEILASDDNPVFLEEARPWIRMFGFVSQMGLHTLELQQAFLRGDRTAFMTHYRRVRALQIEMYELNARYNQNPYQPGIKAGSKVMLPTAANVFKAIVTAYNEKYGTQLEANDGFVPFDAASNLDEFTSQPVQIHKHQVALSPKLEYTYLNNGDYVGIRLDRMYNIRNLIIGVGHEQMPEGIQVLVGDSPDTATPIEVKYHEKRKGFVPTAQIKSPARYVILKNVDGGEVSVKLEAFSFEIN